MSGDSPARSRAKRALRRDVLTTVHSVVEPVIADVQRALTGTEVPRGADWPGLAERLEALHAEVIDVVDRLTDSALAPRGAAVREELFAAMHGPVLGRLASSVMALSFHGATSPSGTDSAAAAALAARVREHLDAVCPDLVNLRRA